jgi:small ligand-binding sensory domain FIST
MARFGDGLAIDMDLSRASDAAVAQALDGLDGGVPDLLCVFVCGEDPDAVEQAGRRAAALSGARAVLGCSASGVIGAGQGVEAMSAVSVWAGVLPGVRIRTFHLEVMRTPDGMAVVGLPERADDEVGVLLADPYSFPVDGFVARANEALAGLPLVGGVATGFRGPGSTRLFIDGRAVDRGAVGALLAGDVRARALVSQGCRPVGPEMTVTAAAGNVLLELAGTPALDKLQEIVAALPPGDQALATQGLQIGIAMDEYAEEHDQGDFLIRGIAGADNDRGGIIVGDLVEVGRTVRFQVRDADAADDDLIRTLSRLRGESAERVDGALLFSCNGRGRALFPTADPDVLSLRRALAPAGVGGFFAGGEIGPVSGRNYVHGFTASILAFDAEALAEPDG